MVNNRVQRFVLKKIDRMLRGICSFLGKVRSKELNAKDINRVLVIKLSAMGDALALMPTLRAVKSTFQECQITWLTTHRTNPELFTNLPFVDEIVTLIPVRRKTIRFFLKVLLQGYDLSIDFDQYYQASEIISFIASRGNNVGFGTKLKGKSAARALEYNPGINEKIMFYNLANTAFSGALTEANFILPELSTGHTLSDDVMRFSGQLDGQIIYIYAGSSDNASFRRWPIERFLELAGMINKEFPEYRTVFIGGPDETCFKKVINKAQHPEIINEYSLNDVFDLMTKARLFIGNDGGLLHLADSAGLPVVGIFGPALYAKWGSVNSKSQAVEVELSCRPCLRNWEAQVPRSCHKGMQECLMKLSVNKVFSSVKEALSCRE